MTLEERKQKFNELVDTILKAKGIMNELNAEPMETAEHILSVDLSKWDTSTGNGIMLSGYGDQDKVDIVKLDKVEEACTDTIRFYTYVKGFKVYMIGDKE